MATVIKCDRCGVIYPPRKGNNNTKEDSDAEFLKYGCTQYGIHLDLCTDCKKSLYKWLSGELVPHSCSYCKSLYTCMTSLDTAVSSCTVSGEHIDDPHHHTCPKWGYYKEDA